MIVTGPSLTSSTAIRAPKTPVSNVDVQLAERVAEAVVERLRELGPRGARERRPVALRRVGDAA